MFPVLLTIGSIPISSFGLFLLIAFLVTSYIIWKIAIIYDFDGEKTLDLILVTFIGSLLGARIYYIISHFADFDNFLKMILIYRYPGLSFWGGLLVSILMLKIMSRRFKTSFFLVSDFAIVGVFIAIAITSVGCLLSSCQSGQPSDLPFAVTQVGLLHKRFPLQLVESLLFFVFFLRLWADNLKFHISGQITYEGLIILGILKFIIEFFRGNTQTLFYNLSGAKISSFAYSLTLGHLFSLLIIFFGIIIYYKVNKKSVFADIKFGLSLFINGHRRRTTVSKFSKSWYNLVVSIKLAARKWPQKVFRSINVKSNPTKF